MTTVAIKEKLVSIAKQNQKEDMSCNTNYWSKVISDISKADESKLLEIMEMDFGFETPEQVLNFN